MSMQYYNHFYKLLFITYNNYINYKKYFILQTLFFLIFLYKINIYKIEYSVNQWP